MEGARRLANEVRVGLEQSAAVSMAPVSTQQVKKCPLAELYFGRPVRQHLKEFGALFATIAIAIAAKGLYDGKAASVWGVWLTVGALFAVLGYLVPRALLPVWRGWMKLAHYLSIVMTFVILGLIWAIGFVPMATLLKTLRIKVMDLSYRANVDTYWEKRDAKYDDFKRLEQQF